MHGQNKQAKTPTDYIAALDEPRKSAIQQIHDFIRQTVPDFEPIVKDGYLGYGPIRYKYASGKEGNWFKVGLASNKQSISIYICAVIDGQYVAEKHREHLKPAQVGKSCIRYKKVTDIHWAALAQALTEARQGTFGM